MRASGKSNKKTDFFKKRTFQPAQLYISNQKLRGATKLLAEKLSFIEAASNIRQLKASNGSSVTAVQSRLSLHARFAADVFAHNLEKYRKTVIALNAVLLHHRVRLQHLLKFVSTARQ